MAPQHLLKIASLSILLPEYLLFFLGDLFATVLQVARQLSLCTVASAVLPGRLCIKDEAAVVKRLLYMLLSHELALEFANHARLRVRSLNELGQESLIHTIQFIFTIPRLRLQL